jgi:hypothetical protein
VNRPRDRRSAAGLLHRMEARPWKDGKTVTYRYHPIRSAPINLGTDKAEAVRRVALMIGQATEEGTIGTLWEHFTASPDWSALSERTRCDYTEYSVELLRVFASTAAAEITAPMVARYLQPVRFASMWQKLIRAALAARSRSASRSTTCVRTTPPSTRKRPECCPTFTPHRRQRRGSKSVRRWRSAMRSDAAYSHRGNFQRQKQKGT